MTKHWNLEFNFLKRIIRLIIAIWQYGIIHAYIDYQAARAYEASYRSELAAIAKSPKLSAKNRRKAQATCILSSVSPVEAITICVCIPCLCGTLEDLGDLVDTLESLHGQGYGIVVCVDGPSQFIHDIICVATRLADVTILMNDKRSGAAFSRNRCLDYICQHFPSATRIVMLDAGIIVKQRWHNFLQQELSGAKYDQTLISGNTLSMPHRTDSLVKYLLDRYHDNACILNPRFINGKVLYAPTCNVILPRSAFHVRFLQDQFPDAGFEDVEYCIRLRNIYKLKLIYLEQLVAYHRFHNYLLDDLRNRFSRYGRNHVKFLQVYPHYDFIFRNTRSTSQAQAQGIRQQIIEIDD